ncbi:MAG: DUF4215 domain-containing protein [Polyangia bacterium]
MRPEHPARLIAILSAWLLLACSSSGVPTATVSGNGGNDGTAGNGGGGGGGILGTGQTVRPDAALDQTPSGCGDGILTKDEACDDHNTLSNDGCSADCRRVEPGYSCFPVGQPCHQIARCGDGVKVPPEQCDDGNTVAGDGCSPICQIETGFQCSGTQPNDPNDTSTSVCTPTVCGDGKVEGVESCDDGNSLPFDGCSADCQNEPDCRDDACILKCGDGIVVPGEECDDGNNVDGDGCSKDCKIERGWSCPQPTLVDKLMLPVIYRDFRYHTPPEFEASVPIETTAVLGMVNEDLDVDGKPVYSGLGGNSHITTAGAFAEWYRDLPGINHSTASKLALWDNGRGGNVNRYGANGEQWQETISADWCGSVGYEVEDPNGNSQPCTFAYGQTVCDADAALGYTLLKCASDGTSYSATFAINLDGNPFFFPVDDDLFTPMNERSIATIPAYYDPAMTKPHDVDADGNERMHNFSFTSEVRYWFRYDKNLFSRLDVTGEDDVWVFMNKKLALDLGGVHAPLEGSVTLDADTASGLGLADGNVYEVAIFQAQRQTSESSYKLTLTAFNAAPSQCASRCGDGIVSLGEECDDGVNAGGYGQCGRDCKLGAYCGDGIVQPAEDCDDGINNGHPCPSGCRNLIDN